jgi:hypothetical protein
VKNRVIEAWVIGLRRILQDGQTITCDFEITR